MILCHVIKEVKHAQKHKFIHPFVNQKENAAGDDVLMREDVECCN